MSLIRAHFDGKVFVPDEPVDCAKGQPVQLVVMQDDNGERPLMDLAQIADAFPIDPAWPADGAAEVEHYLYGTPKHAS